MRGLSNQSGEHLENLRESNILKKRKSISRTLFPVESTDNKSYNTYHRVVADGCIWEGISLMDAC